MKAEQNRDRDRLSKLLALLKIFKADIIVFSSHLCPFQNVFVAFTPLIEALNKHSQSHATD